MNSTVRSVQLPLQHAITPTRRGATPESSRDWMDSHASRHRNFPFWNRCKHIQSLRTHSFEQRCVAVVVDPLRQEHGVFTSERNAQNRHAGTAMTRSNSRKTCKHAITVLEPPPIATKQEG